MPDQLTVPWRRVAAGLLLVSVATTTTLTIVVAVNDVDVLSTVALALAILAFAAQLASSVVQGQASSQQILQSERLNSDTHSLLTEIRTATTGLRGTIEGQFETVLRHALGEAIPETLSESSTLFDPDEFEARLLDNLGRKLDELALSSINGYRSQTVQELRANNDSLEPGDVVVHAKWGTGKILATHGSGDRREARVDFGAAGEKNLLLAWAPLKTIRRPTQTNQVEDPTSADERY